MTTLTAKELRGKLDGRLSSGSGLGHLESLAREEPRLHKNILRDALGQMPKLGGYDPKCEA